MKLNLDKSTWKRVALGDVVRHVTDRTDPEMSGLERFLAGEHIPSDALEIKEWGVIGRDPIGPMFYKRFQPGHVLYVSRRSYLRKTAVPEFPGITGEKTFVLETRDNQTLRQDFLPFVLSADVFHAYAVTNSRGSVNPYLNWTELAAYQLALPPLDEQRRLVSLLWRIEKHRRATARRLDALRMALSSWLSWQLASGETLSSWERVAVPHLVLSGPTNGKSATANGDGRGVPTLSISAVRDGMIRGGESIKYVDVEAATVAAFRLQRDDFLVVRGNGNRRLTGLGGLVGSDLPAGCVYPDLLIRLRFDPKVIDPTFAAAQWNSQAAHSELIRRAKSTNGIWKINGKDIRAHILAVPPMDEQRRIVRELTQFGGAIDKSDAELSAIRGLALAASADVFGGAE